MKRPRTFCHLPIGSFLIIGILRLHVSTLMDLLLEQVNNNTCPAAHPNKPPWPQPRHQELLLAQDLQPSDDPLAWTAEQSPNRHYLNPSLQDNPTNHQC